jgi:hypothetical protein
MGEMRIITSYAQEEVNKLPPKMRQSGDSKVVWDPENEDQTEVAKITFDNLKAKGYKAFKVDKKGEPKKEIKKFDPKSGLLIMTPSIAGG